MQQRPIVQNVLSSAKLILKDQLDLLYLASRIQNSRYNKRRWPGLIVRKSSPKCTLMLFKSGKIVCLGSESQRQAQLAVGKIARDIQKLMNIKCQVQNFRVSNLISCGHLGYSINITSLADQPFALKDDSFAGVIYRDLKLVKSTLIFHSGKVTFTGTTSKQAIEQAFDQLKIKLKKFEKIPFIPTNQPDLSIQDIYKDTSQSTQIQI